MKDIKNLIKKYSLQNAIKFDGRANTGAVIGKILAENPDLKKKIKEISKQVNEVVREVNKLKLEQQIEKLQKIAPELLEKKKRVKKHELPPLKNPKKVIMRFEPSPSGPLHIGHAYVLGLNSEYCRRYKGKLILRIGDTNPENIYGPAYKMIEGDARWLTKNNISEIIVQSDRMERYYRHAEKLIEMGKAYVCTCDAEEFRELIQDKKECDCRALTIAENLKRWKRMLSDYREGEAVVRIKTGVDLKNPALRDWPALRINQTSHPRQGKKYRVWPLMNFSVSVDDIEMGITHIIRAKDHMDNALKQEFIYRFLKKTMPQTIFVGRINFEDMKVSASYTRAAIEERKFLGWDDIRLPFLEALKRRGYEPDAFIRYAIETGVTAHDKSVSKEEFFKNIDAYNRGGIDKKANRYFFVAEPVEIRIKNAPEQIASLELHPDFPERGKRSFRAKDGFYITKQDFEKIKQNQLVRLIGCLNFRRIGKDFVFDSIAYEDYRNMGGQIIHWVPKEENIDVEVLMPNNKLKKGYGEKNILDMKIGEVCQLERFGFCRLDSKAKNKVRFWFAHK